MREVFVSVDIETDGPIPGEYSMLSLGAAALDRELKVYKTFSVNLQRLQNARQDPDTMDWWKKWPDAWKKATENAEPPEVAMQMFKHWLENELDGRPVFVAYPAGFDFTFVYWYFVKFLGDLRKCPFAFLALDMKSFGMALQGTPFYGTHKGQMPWKRISGKHLQEHVAVDDAVEQAEIFSGMLREARNRPASGERERERERTED